MTKFMHHLRRFGWVAIALLATAAYPAWILRQTKGPELDPATAVKLFDVLDAAMIERYGEPDNERARELLDTYTYAPVWFDRPTRMMTNTTRGGLGSPSAKPQIERARERFGPMLDAWSAFDRESVVYVSGRRANWPRHRRLQSTESLWDASLFQATARMMLHGMFSVDAAASGDWDAAYDEIERAGRTVMPVQSNGIYLAPRRFEFYETVGRFLAMDPPEDFERRVFELLIELRASEPELNRLHLLHAGQGEFTPEGDEFNTHEKLYVEQKYFLLGQAAYFLSDRAESFESERLRTRGEYYAARYFPERGGVHPTESEMYDWAGENPAMNALSMVSTRALSDWVGDVAVQEKIIPDILLITEKEAAESDPLTLGVFFGAYAQTEWIARNHYAKALREMKTKARLVELAYAARRFEREEGRWPESVDEIPLAWFAPAEGSERTDEVGYRYEGNANEPYLPFKMGWLDVDAEVRDVLWKSSLPGDINNILDMAEERNERSYEFLESKPSNYNPSHAALRKNIVAEGFASHKKLVEWVRAEKLVGGSRYAGKWEAMDPEEARRISFESYAMEGKKLVQEGELRREDGGLPGGLSQAEVDSVEGRTVEVPRAMRLHLKLKAPERVFAIWSPGLDGDNGGDDDGARVLIKRIGARDVGGDIVVFPEGY